MGFIWSVEIAMYETSADFSWKTDSLSPQKARIWPLIDHLKNDENAPLSLQAQCLSVFEDFRMTTYSAP